MRRTHRQYLHLGVRRDPEDTLNRLAEQEHEQLQLAFLTQYLIRTREEIDLEKAERTKLLHLKVIAIGAFLALGSTLGDAMAAGMLLMPLLFFAIDRLQSAHLEYIFQRWTHLAEYIIPRIRATTNDDRLVSFEEGVNERIKDRYYQKMEATVRTLLIIPAIAASVVSMTVLLVHRNLGSWVVHGTSIAWLLCLTGIAALIQGDNYRRTALVSVSLVTATLWTVSVYLA